MTDLIIPNPRFEMPELFYPGRKPVGNVKIDWDHPLADGLVDMCLLGGAYSRSVGGREYTSITFNTHPAEFQTSVNNNYLSVSVDMSSWSGATFILDLIDIQPMITGNTRLLSVLRAANSADDIRIYIPSTGNVTDVIVAWDDGSITNQNISINTDSKLGISHDGTTAKVFIDGILVSSVSDVCDITEFTGDVFLGKKEDAGVSTFATHSSLTIYNRAVLDVEIASLSENPYQFLIPAG